MADDVEGGAGSPTPDEFEAAWEAELQAQAGGDAQGSADGDGTDGAGTEGDEVDKPKPNAQPEPAAAPPATAAPPAAPAPDAIERLERLVTGVSQELKTVSGRVSAMQSEMDRARQAQQATRQAGGDAPSGAQIDAAAGDPEKWNKLKEDWPEWAEAMEELLNSRFSRMPKPSQAPAPVDMNALRQEVKNDLRMELQVEMIVDKYPDWDAVVKTNEFQTWFRAQPAEVQAKAESDRGRDVISVLDSFYEARKATQVTQQRRQEKLTQAAAGAHVGRGAPPPPKGDDEKTLEEIWEEEAAAAGSGRR